MLWFPDHRSVMSVKNLIARAKHSSQLPFALEGAALADLRKVLRANAKEPNRFKRVTLEQMRQHLEDEHDIVVSTITLRRALAVQLGARHGVMA